MRCPAGWNLLVVSSFVLHFLQRLRNYGYNIAADFHHVPHLIFCVLM